MLKTQLIENHSLQIHTGNQSSISEFWVIVYLYNCKNIKDKAKPHILSIETLYESWEEKQQIVLLKLSFYTSQNNTLFSQISNPHYIDDSAIYRNVILTTWSFLLQHEGSSMTPYDDTY